MLTNEAPPVAPAPVAVFAYNRPDRLQTMMRSLQNCIGFESTQVTIFVDGPKSADDRRAVESVKAVVTGIQLPNVKYRFRDINLGLRESIFAGVSQLIEECGRVIVIEDDLVLSPFTLLYFNSALDFYQTNEQVWSVSGYIYDSRALRDSSKAVILPFAHPWGWATWKRAWASFDLNARPAEKHLKSDAFRSAFDMNGLYPFTSQLENSLAGRVNSWFIHWYYTLFVHRAVSVFPPRRLVDNHGLNSGSHGSFLNPTDRLLTRPKMLQFVPNFDEGACVDYPALDSLKSCKELRVQRFVAQSGMAKRKVRQLR